MTGLTGFVGGNLVKQILDIGGRVVGVARTPKYDCFLAHETDKFQHPLLKVYQTDLQSVDALSQIIAEEHITDVFHLAAQVEVGVAGRNPHLTFETNIRGTYNLLESCWRNRMQIKSIVVASSDKAYGEYPVEMMPYREDYPLRPNFPYDVSKACGDLIATSYGSGYFGLPIVVTRFANIYGPGQLNFSALVPDLCRSSLGLGSFIPRSDGTHRRDFLYVSDVCDLYLKISDTLHEGSEKIRPVYNAGTGKSYSVIELIKLFYLELIGDQREYDRIEQQMSGKNPSGEIHTQFMNFDLVERDFRWVPTTSLREGLKDTLTWYESYFNNLYGK